MKSFTLFLALFFLFPNAQASRGCRESLDRIDRLELGFSIQDSPSARDLQPEIESALRECKNQTCSPSFFSSRLTSATGKFFKKNRGYAILIGTMIGSAAATTYLTSALPKDFGFLAQLLSQISVLGIYVFGAPIWEPLSSGFRKLAFGVSQNENTLPSTTANQTLESMWFNTQESYSLNAQMSRNIIAAFIASTRQNFFEAHRAIHSQDQSYAVDQIAEAAIRLRTLFKDIPADEPSVALAVRTAFSNSIKNPDLALQILEKIKEYDSNTHQPEVLDYYKKVLKAWFIDLYESNIFIL